MRNFEKRKILKNNTFKFLCMLAIVLAGIYIGSIRTYAADNTSMDTAQYINIDGTIYSGSAQRNDPEKYFKFTLPESGKITFNYKAYWNEMITSRLSNAPTLNIYDANSKNLVYMSDTTFDNITGIFSYVNEFDLTQGTYYLVLNCRYIDNCTFDFLINFKSANESFKETLGGNNNMMSTTNTISLGKKYTGQIALNDNKDFYKFTNNSNCKLKINMKSHYKHAQYYIYDSNGYEIFNKTSDNWSENTKVSNNTSYVNLNKGTYYLCVTINSEEYDDTGNYDFTLTTSAKYISLSKQQLCLARYKSYTLKSTLTPATNEAVKWTSSDNSIATVNSKGVVYAKKPGYAQIKAVVGDNVTATCAVYVKPKTCKITKFKLGLIAPNKTRTVNVYWKGLNGVDGYQIYYATSRYGKYKCVNSTFWHPTTTTHYYLKRRKTYYFKMRAFKYANYKYIYGNFSKVKKIRVK